MFNTICSISIIYLVFCQTLITSLTHSSRTIEMADFENALDVAVIDEIQIALDKDRGWAWIAALCGLPASEIIVAGNPSALPVIQRIADLCGDTLETKDFPRNGDLKMEHLVSWKSIPKSSAIVCFSRKMVLQVRDIFQDMGIPCSAVYGDLSPEVRREEARRFREGETLCVVATDAIGMGLNLPIEYVLFWETDKFDGDCDRVLMPVEIQQIAGRAGRGLRATGYVSAFSKRDHELIEKAMAAPVPPVVITTLDAGPTSFHIETIANELKEYRLAILLTFFKQRMTFEDVLRPFVSKDTIITARVLDDISTAPSVPDRLTWVRSPLNSRDNTHKEEFQKMYHSFCKGNPCQARICKIPKSDLGLLEHIYQSHRIYRWLAKHFPTKFPDIKHVETEISTINVRLQDILSKKHGMPHLQRNECRWCGRAILPDSHYTECNKCHNESLNDNY